jgi:soluble lytic murein transglycosylase-like protein
MRRTLILLATTIAAAMPASAGAAVPHTVAAGETLWTIASASNLTNRALAAYNGLPAEGNVILGSTIMVPSPVEAAAAMAAAGLTPTNPGTSGTVPVAEAAPAPAVAPSAPQPLGGYTVRWGDTLSGLAAVARVPMEQIAAANGLDPAAPLLAGTVLKLPSGTPTPPRAAQPAPTATVVPPAAPQPTPARASAEQIQSIAAAHGVPGSLAAAIAWQESGFNNAMVSAANARGVMQIMPGTWSWIQQTMAPGQLDPASVDDNVRAGALYLNHLLAETGGDQAAAAAAYYQGLGSLRSRGMFEDTKQYVANVQALQARFGG